MVPLLAIERRGAPPRLLQLIRDHPDDLAIMDRFMATGLGGAAFRDDSAAEKAARALGMLGRAPGFFAGPARRWVNGRLRRELGTSLPGLLASGLAGRARVGAITLTSHHFMSAAEMATPLGRQRLDACVFRLPYQGEMVPMCRMNAAGVRDQVYGEIAAGGGEPGRPAL